MKSTSAAERGSALVLALAFVALFGAWTAVVLNFADAGVKVTQRQRERLGLAYAAEAGIETAIEAIRADLTKGNSGGPCPDVNAPVINGYGSGGNSIVVECQGLPGSGAANFLGGSPALGILTTATGGEDGLIHDSNEVLRINGGVYSHSTIVINAANARLNACPPDFPAQQVQCTPAPGARGSVTALGLCDPLKIVAIRLNCPMGVPTVLGTDPNYPPAQSVFPQTATVPSPAQACPNGGRNALIELFPGRYSDAAALSALTTGGCTRSLLWLHPGAYYFDFPAARPVWSVADRHITIVGGNKTWAATPNPPSEAPVPGSCDPAQDGVELIFGGPSRWEIRDAAVEVCGRQTGPDQWIAIYGVKSPQDDLAPPPPGNCLLQRPFPAAAGSCPLVRTVGGPTRFVIQGVIYAPAVPVDLQLTNVGSEVVTRGILSRVLRIGVTPSSTFTGAMISAPGLGSVTSSRAVLFTACLGRPCRDGGSARLRATVSFDDGDGFTPGRIVSIKSFSVVK